MWEDPEIVGDNVPVLVVVLNDAADLAYARDLGWYRIPLAHAPRRVAADYLAFYQTGAFPPAELGLCAGWRRSRLWDRHAPRADPR